MARPSDYTPETAAIICERIAEGESVTEICKGETMPSKSTVMRWLAAHTEFRDQYARAKELQADHFAEEILEISDNGRNDWMDRQFGESDPIRVVDHEHITRSKLRVDARKWLMSKMAPKKYGDRTTLVGDPDAPLGVRVLSADPMSADDWERQYGDSDKPG